jgi:hypothetical protein
VRACDESALIEELQKPTLSSDTIKLRNIGNNISSMTRATVSSFMLA